MQLPDVVVLPIEQIRPYSRNPRRIPEDAVAAVADSITRYGYTQPIVVDSEHVVIVGHTRLLAVQRLGWTEVPVYVASNLSKAKVDEYRLVDNRTGEMSTWDYSALVTELREFDITLLTTYFPDVDLEIGQVKDTITQAQVDEAGRKITKVTEANPATTHTTSVVCPACFHTFEVRTKSLPGLTSADLDEMAYANGTTE